MTLYNAVMEVLSNDVYLENSHKIKCTLKNAGGYIKAAETIELFKLKTVLNKMPQLPNTAAGASYYFFLT